MLKEEKRVPLFVAMTTLAHWMGIVYGNGKFSQLSIATLVPVPDYIPFQYSADEYTPL